MKIDSFNKVLIKTTPKGQGVFANYNFTEGETVIIGKRVKVVPDRTVYSLQMGFDLHIDIDEPGRLINHSCSPNTGVRNNEFGGYDFVAISNIALLEEITFDYETTECIVSAFSKCLCGSVNCRVIICGFNFNSEELKLKSNKFIADYLK
ncbi:SET domain-containing protein-lysine N-methyltransferase [Nostoc sp. FACHB-152]|uniref:SET domain-containing protein-lysine N-methyltransferase n=1 Tax=unclassified Nostoc TaxID=2593658 RepID=UPI0016842302|nr:MULTISPECIES: SET domain-containing protein-lysine N-methyltransferase [unclassified Nostoc]MBD2446502.1 SET domain-containing protein-lysine N-methyltransferase [Nostoc sp. FACHB-152]MBD2468701.1 SET domain-containing protein-lysine N-methyltransferase [Nostoc sp. FACHB-145]